jgi:hypothetical protein
MATTINEPNEITLPDGTVLAVRPLKISILREFMKTFSSIEDVAEDNDKSMDLLIECVRIAMRQYKPELAEDAAKLEDLLDLPTVYRIIEEASGTAMGNQFVSGRG